MHVLHISPTYFAEESIVGGGERYAQELAHAMAELVPTTFLSFGPQRRSYLLDRLRVEILPSHPLPWRHDAPFSARLLPWLARADVLHCHQLGTPANVLALLAARAMRKPRFLTPLGAAPTLLEHRLTQLSAVSSLLCISHYSADRIWYRRPRRVIYGGVDADLFRPRAGPRERKIVCVARIVPHKGINYLIEAVEPDMRLEIYGQPYDRHYYRDLQTLAKGKDVTFFTDASDADIAHAQARALAAVLPSVHRDMYGNPVAEPELLGLSLLEGMACGAAAVGSRVTSIPEIVQEGVNGYLVPPGDPAALRTVLRRLLDDPQHAMELGRNGCALVRRQFTWKAVAERSLAAYREVT